MAMAIATGLNGRKTNMTQEELMEQSKNYIDNNINDENKLIIAKDILDNLANAFYENGYVSESNKLVTCIITINEVLESGSN